MPVDVDAPRIPYAQKTLFVSQSSVHDGLLFATEYPPHETVELYWEPMSRIRLSPRVGDTLAVVSVFSSTNPSLDQFVSSAPKAKEESTSATDTAAPDHVAEELSVQE